MQTELNSRGWPMLAVVAFAAAATLAPTGARAAVDVAAAEGLARQSGCFACHSVDKKKVGPPYQEVAAKYKSDKDAVAKLTKHISGGGKIRGEGGKDEEHPALKSKKPEDIKTVVDWILSR